jgi:hypothetical protein
MLWRRPGNDQQTLHGDDYCKKVDVARLVINVSVISANQV